MSDQKSAVLPIRVTGDDLRFIDEAAGGNRSAFVREALALGLEQMGVPFSGKVKKKGWQNEKTPATLNPEAVPA